MRLVSVVISTRSPIFTRSRISPSTSSTCERTGRTSTSGSASPVGRTTSSTTLPPDWRNSYGPGVADTKMVRGSRCSHSSNFSGRLSSALGKRKPNSTKVSLRERSPLYIAPNCGIVTCDRSEEHTSELQSHVNLVCRLLLEKKKKKYTTRILQEE